ncbi:cupin domain-containing protein [Methanolobus vulcani]|jgi:quercetin dioxygenase-like cupin family protein|uniref:Cupin domain-containing protein n=1 Tax=Methanolobus vulcani TaxID=38026 RepID=A0A7Z8P504_9EURY|nr:cupin domain-containing protein [Methanolobus vulcani]TQD26394.1 cupin domain-containing protein [Methanolobus vulcani]
MFTKHSESDYKEVLPGIMMKTIVYGEKTLMTEFLLQKESHLPSHEHFHEQTGYMISGKMLLTIGDETYEVTAGDSWNIPSNIPHEAQVIEDSVAVEVFSPCRKEYLD